MKQTDNISAGYKLSPLGIIPKDWEVKRLGEMGEFTKGFGVPKDKMVSKGLPCLTYGDIYTKYDVVINDIRSFIPEVVAVNSKQIEFGDLLFSGSGETPEDIGKCVAYNKKEVAYAGGDIIILKPNNNINSIVLSYILNSCIGGRQRYKLAQGHSIVHIYPYNLESIIVPFPPLPEQQKIAEILSVWDSAIEKQTALIEKLETRKRALMQQLLTGKKRLKGFSGDNDLKKLKPYITELSERNNDKKVTTVLSVTNANGFISQSEQFGRSVASEDITNYKIVRKGQFAFNPSRVNVGSLDLLRTFDAGILSPMYIVFTTDITALDAMFLYYQLKSGWFLKHIPMYVQGSVRDSLTFDALCAMKFFIPTLPEQTAIAEILTTADNEIALAKQKLDSIRQQKKGLMQVLLTGKKRVKI